MVESEVRSLRAAISKWKLLEVNERVSYEQILTERDHGEGPKQRTDEILNRHLLHALCDFAPTIETDQQDGKRRSKRIYVLTEDDARALWAAVNTLESSLVAAGNLHRHADKEEGH